MINGGKATNLEHIEKRLLAHFVLVPEEKVLRVHTRTHATCTRAGYSTITGEWIHWRCSTRTHMYLWERPVHITRNHVLPLR